MRIVGVAMIVLSAIASGAALALSVYPGLIQEVIFWAMLAAVFVVPTGAVVGLLLLIVLWKRVRLRLASLPLRHAAVAIGILSASYLALKFYLPRRLAFLAHQSRFDALADQAPKVDLGVACRRRVGIYWVREFAADPRGGVYLATWQAPDGIGPDVRTYGFCRRPNTEGSPFGAAGYRVRRLFGDWYWFTASDDWR